jgi:hypothetical protein
VTPSPNRWKRVRFGSFFLQKRGIFAKRKVLPFGDFLGRKNSSGEGVLDFYVEPPIPVLNRKGHTIPVKHKWNLESDYGLAV